MLSPVTNATKSANTVLISVIVLAPEREWPQDAPRRPQSGPKMVAGSHSTLTDQRPQTQTRKQTAPLCKRCQAGLETSAIDSVLGRQQPNGYATE